MNPAGGKVWLRAGAGALVGVALATLAWVVGVDRQAPLASLALIAGAAGPAFLMLGVALALGMSRPGNAPSKKRLIAALLGMAGSVSTLLGLMLGASLLIGVYALLFAYKLFLPMLLGGLGVGIACPIPRPGPRRGTT
jgi:hypothetical protein